MTDGSIFQLRLDFAVVVANLKNLNAFTPVNSVNGVQFFTPSLFIPCKYSPESHSISPASFVAVPTDMLSGSLQSVAPVLSVLTKRKFVSGTPPLIVIFLSTIKSPFILMSPSASIVTPVFP